MIACSTFSAARNVRSTTEPVRTFLSVVRTKAPPLPGLTCWNSTTSNRPSSRSRVIPFLRSLVVVVGMGRSAFWAGSRQGGGLGGVRQRPAPVLGDHQGVLDAHTAVLRQVDARFDGHDLAGAERSIARRRHPRGLVDVEAHAVAGGV